MNILDENVATGQRLLLESWGIRVRKVGREIGRKGMDDEAIIRLLQHLRRATFFTRDLGFYDRALCHSSCCIVCLAVRREESALFVRRILKHRKLETVALRMGKVIRVTRGSVRIWRLNAIREEDMPWNPA